MAIKFILHQQELSLDQDQLTAAEALITLDLPPESYLLVRDGEMIPETAVLRDGDVIRLVPVIAGG